MGLTSHHANRPILIEGDPLSTEPGTRPAGARSARSAATASSTSPDTTAGNVPGNADLITVARAARDALHQDGRPLTRDALAARLRAAGHPVRYSRLTPLLLTLRTDPDTRIP